ncbi:PRC-barrel domain-containing protein [Halomicroarcula sp. F13]|uniref:PRC-barrel domain-containing protein n=1 Tax=Haloarcula rubra TaxID=2487747 RepID=A0AAW4PZK2_9EURY|nr:PRC-barrel domain-containing protein [Halomicroarcula rubra]MBX0326015.1 PRC-barrel domain-containing protein [Halomicroarcula rubra]
MPQVLANELAEKRVLSTDGRELGILHNVTLDVASGSLETLVVETDHSELFGIEANADGVVQLPAETLDGVSDHVIVSPPE